MNAVKKRKKERKLNPMLTFCICVEVLIRGKINGFGDRQVKSQRNCTVKIKAAYLNSCTLIKL